MSSNLKKITTILFVYLSCFLLISLTTSCALLNNSDAEPLNQRQQIFEKGKALLANDQFAKAEPFFLNLTAEPEEKSDLIYDMSLWNISLIYEKLGLPEKSILALNLLVDRQTEHVLPFKIKAALMKNYFCVGNKIVAIKYKKMLDDEKPRATLATNVLYVTLQQTLNLNYDQLILEELDYVGEAQKYLLYVMEQNQSELNQAATELLISIYERAYALTKKDSLRTEFKEKILISLLDKLRLFETYKLNDLNINLKTVAKFSKFSEKLEKQITDRLHQ